MSEVVAVAALIAAGLSALATLALYAEVGRLSLRLSPERSDLPLLSGEGLPIGGEVPKQLVSGLADGAPIDLWHGTTLMVFLSATCEPCKSLWPSLVSFATKASEVRVLAVVGDDPLAFSTDLVDVGVAFAHDTDGQTAAAFEVKRTPFAYVLDGGRIKSKGVVNGYNQLVTLVAGHGLAQSTAWAS